jgi:hypothetical protein
MSRRSFRRPGDELPEIDGTLSPSASGREARMPWYNALGIGRRTGPPADPPPAALTAAAAPVQRPEQRFLQHTANWQSEAWRYYDELGEFNTGVSWLASMMSRVRLRAAELQDDTDEPRTLDAGPAADIIGSLSGGVGGQSQLMRSMTIQAAVPGDCYLVGQSNPDEEHEDWTVRSMEEIRVQNRKFQVVTDRVPTIVWSDLPDDSMPVRIWKPHARFYHLADSVARSALPIMRELELVNRHIVAQYLSRLASAGLLILPNEVEFPVREEFADAPDPFTAEFVEIAMESIRQPGTASAVVPMPIKVPAEYVDKIKHIDFTLKIDDKIIEKRDSVINRLANKLDIPAEILTGRSQANHWTAWVLDEDALKTHIAPTAETICDSLTRGYLWPRLKASGMKAEEYTKYVAWYDMSELAQRPDKSTNAQAAYDRLELSGEALRREGGFDEDDAPKDDELIGMVLKALIRNNPGDAASALNALAGRDVLEIAPPATKIPAESPNATGGAPGGKAPEEAPPNGKAPGPPEQPNPSAPPKAPAGAKAADERAIRTTAQIRALHALTFGIGVNGDLLHPPVCREHAYSCPFTHAAMEASPPRLATGTYECRLDAFGRLAVGAPAPYLDTSDWIATPGLNPSRRGGVSAG